MNILHLANTPLSGAPYRLMQVQRTGGINARLISHRSSFDGRSHMVFPHDIVLQSGRSNQEKRRDGGDFKRDEIYDLFRSADVIHLHNNLADLYIFRVFPELGKYLSTTPVVMQFHSPRLSLKNVEKDLKDIRVGRRLVVAQYQVRQFPKATPVPNAVPIHDRFYTPCVRDNRNPLIVYSPSNTNLRDWNNKGYPETMAALKRVKAISENRIITNTPQLECLAQKQSGDIAIDEIVTGSYHLNTLEALSQGQVAICGLDDLCEEALCECTGTDKHPIVKASPKTLEKVLRDYINDPDMLRETQESSRSFMETYWNADCINKAYKKAYNF